MLWEPGRGTLLQRIVRAWNAPKTSALSAATVDVGLLLEQLRQLARELGAAADRQRREHVRQVVLDGAFDDLESLGDLAVAIALRGEECDADLLCAEAEVVGEHALDIDLAERRGRDRQQHRGPL